MMEASLSETQFTNRLIGQCMQPIAN